MRPKRWIPLALFLGAALLSAWLSPALSPALSLGWIRAVSRPSEIALPGEMDGRTLLRSGEALDVKVGPYAIQAVVQAAISLPLWVEDSQIYLPLIRR